MTYGFVKYALEKGIKIRLQVLERTRWKTVVQGRFSERTLSRMKEWMERNKKFEVFAGARLQAYRPSKEYKGVKLVPGAWCHIGTSVPYLDVLWYLNALKKIQNKEADR
ncbi:hypothetical protein DRO58_08565 [Candidatus Bathyarchaeota archaeon]|nr:MAG: hypothetical protein DRO58_08565 [Candidatus Bathyarchaeota archaeon]